MAEKRRVKTYSAQSGYVWQYMSESTSPSEGQFTFWISTNGRDFKKLAVRAFNADQLLGRTASAAEIYGLAKLRLHEFLDQHASNLLTDASTLSLNDEQAARYAVELRLIEN
jgi:hypothetical protein